MRFPRSSRPIRISRRPISARPSRTPRGAPKRWRHRWRRGHEDPGRYEPVAGKEPTMPTVEVVDAEMARILRGKTEAERLAIGWAMWRSARDMFRNLLRAEHPDWPTSAIHR